MAALEAMSLAFGRLRYGPGLLSAKFASVASRYFRRTSFAAGVPPPLRRRDGSREVERLAVIVCTAADIGPSDVSTLD